MGYETHYTLTIHPEGSNLADCAFEQLIKDSEGAECTFSEGNCYNGSYNGTSTWYEYPTDMATISRKFPRLVFELEGCGDESGDWWRKAWKDGKIIFDVVAVLPEFDPEPHLTDFEEPTCEAHDIEQYDDGFICVRCEKKFKLVEE